MQRGSAQAAAVLRMGPYGKCKSCWLLLPLTHPKNYSAGGTHGNLTAHGVVGARRTLCTALTPRNPDLTSFPGIWEA